MSSIGTIWAHIECAALVQTFAQSVDARRYGDAVNVFTDDGVFERPGARFEGKEAIGRFLQSRSNLLETRHVCTPPVLSDVSDDRASGISYLVMFHGPAREDGVPLFDGPAGVFEYHDRFSHTVAGWRISHRATKVAMLAVSGTTKP